MPARVYLTIEGRESPPKWMPWAIVSLDEECELTHYLVEVIFRNIGVQDLVAELSGEESDVLSRLPCLVCGPRTHQQRQDCGRLC